MMLPPAPPSAPIATCDANEPKPRRGLPKLAAFFIRACFVVASSLQCSDEALKEILGRGPSPGDP